MVDLSEMTGCRAVLFDMDGTLVDSEVLWSVALDELAATYGGVLSVAARARMVGTDTPSSMAILHEDLGQPWRDPVAGGRWLDERMAELFARGLAWRPGARALLTEVRATGLPTALVTNTRRMLVDVAMGTLGRHNFDVSVCGDEVTRAKPDPEPYLTAAAALGIDPASCVAVEDSRSGVASALAAGCGVVAVPMVGPLAHPAPVDARVLVVESLAGVDVSVLGKALVRLW